MSGTKDGSGVADSTDEHGRFSHAADLPRSVARVKFYDTPPRNSTVRVTVEHRDHYRGVLSFLRYSSETAIDAARSHVDGLDASIERVDVTDDAGLGVTESDLLDAGDDAPSASTTTAMGVTDA